MLTNLPEAPCGYFTTSSPGAMTSSTKQSAGSVRVVPHTHNSPLRLLAPHTEMDARLLDGGRQPRQRVGRERKARLECQRPDRPVGRKKGERDRRRVAFFAAQAGPERGVDDRFDRLEVRLRRQIRFAALARHHGLMREVCPDAAGAARAGGYDGPSFRATQRSGVRVIGNRPRSLNIRLVKLVARPVVVRPTRAAR